MQTKLCSKCRKELPMTTEYFFRKKASKDGLNYLCKKCCHEYDRKYCEKHKEVVSEYQRLYRETHKEVSAQYRKKYYNKANEGYIKEYRKKYYNEHKEIFAKWYRDNKKTIDKYRADNKEYINKRGREYTQKNRDAIAEYKREYVKKNREQYRIRTQKRNAKKRLLPCNLNENQWESIKLYFNYECCYCGDKNKLTQDHLIPLSKGGEYTKNNIIPACPSCNCSKNDKDFFEWYPKQVSYSKQREHKILKYLNYDTKTKIQQLSICI